MSKDDSLSRQYADDGRRMMAELGVQSEDELSRYWQDPLLEPDVRAKACVAAGFLQMKTALPIMVELAKNEIPEVAWGAANALALFGNRDAVLPLMQIARGSVHEPARNAAISALGRLHDEQAEGLLCEVLTDQTESEATRTFAACALMTPHDPIHVVAYLLRALEDPSASVRWQALSALGSTGLRDTADAIRKHLFDLAVVSGLPPEEATVAWAAENALGNLLGT